MKQTFAFLVWLALALPSWARLGETERELIARFGEPTMRGQHSIIAQGRIIPLGPQLHFREGDWRIVCDMIDGRCLRIGYGKGGDWTEEQFQTVLAANSQGSRWTETSNTKMAKLQRSWRRSDGSDAKWMSVSGITLTWDAYTKAKAKAEERARVEAARKPKI
jgi:hypothetical protein